MKKNTKKKKTPHRILRLDQISHQKLMRLDREHTAVVATISPLEVHGPHLPLGQDIFEAFTLVEHTVEKLARLHTEWTFLLLPPIPVATDCLPKMGSVNYPVSLVRDLSFYTLRPFAQNGFARLAYASFHGGPRHMTALEDAAARLTEKYDVPAISLFSVALARMSEGGIFFDAIKNHPPRKISMEQLRLDHHAGMVETSMGLHLWPELVEDEWETLPAAVAEPENPDRKTNSSYLFGYSDPGQLVDKIVRAGATVGAIARAVAHFKTNTYFGYPAYASARQGRMIFDHLVEECVTIVTDFIAGGKEMECHSPLWKYRHVLLNAPLNNVLENQLKLYSD